MSHFVKMLSNLILSGFVVIAALSVVVTNAEDCGQEELVQCARPLQVLSDTSELSFVTKKEELDKLCPDLHAGLNCIRSYTRRCMNIAQRNHFNKLYHGTNQVIHELCAEGLYQEDFLKHAPCMRTVKKQYEVCANRYQNTMARIEQIVPPPDEGFNLTTLQAYEEEKIKTVCCAFKDYIGCSEMTVKHTCGDETATFTRTFLDKMSRSLMNMHCVHYEGPEAKKCDEQFSNNAIIISTNPSSFLLLLFLLIMKFSLLEYH